MLFCLAGGVVVILFDYLLYWAVDLSIQHGDITVEFTQNVDVGIKVADGGLLSSYLQKLVGNLNAQTNLNYTIDFTQCLPTAYEPSSWRVIG